jgi:hypothetical protein
MNRKFIISEKQEQELIKRINEEVYQMPVDKKANTPYCINPEKVLIVKKFLDKSFKAHDYEKIGSNGMPIKIKVISMNASNGEPLKYMYKDQLHDLLIDKFQNMFIDKIERSLFMKQVMEDWINGTIGLFGNLTKNSLMENTMEELNSKANEANLTPTDLQKEAGNYKMGHIRIEGMPISIENPKGSYRTYKKENGEKGKIKIKNHYGYFTNTTGNGRDGDAVDVFIGPNADNFDFVYVVDQNNKKGEFDESKVMLGFNSIEHAKKAYLSNFSSDWNGFRSITKVTLKTFKKWLYRGHKQVKPFADYYVIQNAKLNESITRGESQVQYKVARFLSEDQAINASEILNENGFIAYNKVNEVYISLEENRQWRLSECKDLLNRFICEYIDANPKFILSESYINDDNTQKCELANVGNEEIADEIVDEINKIGVYAYSENGIVYVDIEQDFNDSLYFDETLDRCKEIAKSVVRKSDIKDTINSVNEQLENDDTRHIGSLTLVLKQKFPKKWGVYKNNKHIGIFKGNASMSIENDILDNLE